ncbi:PadR family transcriptional regulator [Nonomuraea sp. 3-1Str]|uniref:PadR family transcriptional regulator n=1 Tax=unclassified Nonomuraea TaxID=2593643 RepID=UPI00285B1E71|nr:PadR family transcriptional regulator [Nonomuraea sp. 3-1Str]MDR8410074.1 PadR family transcriptional regulator [Nonomuraea sp. 3-1Str]
MAKRRKVGSLLALAVLSVVAQRPMHAYEMASVLRARGKDQDMAIKWGSLYTVVHNLARHGLLREAGSDRQGGRPERTVYEITAEGRAELADWTRELLSDPEEAPRRFEAGLSVMGGLAPEEVTALLRRRLDALERLVAAQREALERDAGDLPRLFVLESEYALAMREAEAAWTRSLLEELAAGTFPRLAEWRAFHGSGHIPQDMAGLAERGAVTD